MNHDSQHVNTVTQQRNLVLLESSVNRASYNQKLGQVYIGIASASQSTSNRRAGS